jgi:hypothetical protein
MGTSENDARIIVSTDAARGGVTGHNVRYVLAWGLTGVIAAFAAIGIYLGYDRLHEMTSHALAQSPSDIIRAFAPYAAIILVGAIGAGLLLGLWNILWGYEEDATQSGMRIRVVAQFAVIWIIMAIAYLAAG